MCSQHSHSILGLVAQGCAPSDHLVPVSLEATGLFTRPLVPSSSASPFCHKGSQGGLPYPAGPWAPSAGPVYPRLSCSAGRAAWTRYPCSSRLRELCSGNPHICRTHVTCGQQPWGMLTGGGCTGVQWRPLPSQPGCTASTISSIMSNIASFTRQTFLRSRQDL